MADKPLFLDGVTAFPRGVNSGIAPVLLSKDQLSFAINATNRGSYLHPRPIFKKVALDFGGSSTLQTNFEKSKWQGGAYYKPDSGSEVLCAQIGGRLFQAAPNVGNSATVTDISITGDLNPVNPDQAWLWQSEKWMIVNDGQSRPIFYDGTSSRRSVVAGTTVTVKNLDDTAANNPSGTDVNIFYGLTGLIIGNLSAPINIPAGLLNHQSLSFNITAPFLGPLPALGFNFVKIGTHYFLLNVALPVGGPWTSFQVGAISNIPGPLNVPAGTLTEFAHISYPPIGQLLANEVVPAIGATVNITLSQPFSGGIGTILLIGNGKYEVTAFVNVATDELPPGRMGVYGMGRNWLSLTDGRSFVASDVVGGASGSAPFNFRDAVLKIKENTFLASGGVFVVPGNPGDIRAMIFAANLDKALGQGPLQIGTPNNFFTCNAPVNRTTVTPAPGSVTVLDSVGWMDITFPLLSESLKGFGPLGQNSTINANSDIVFRSIAGLGSLVLGRKDFSQEANWGNSPISHEIDRIIAQDSTSLLQFGSATTTGNRLLMTSKPTPSDQGVYHRGIIAMNLDTVSNLADKLPACYDGLWTGLNILQAIRGIFSGVDRTFAFCLNTLTSTIELYEISTDDRELFDDNGSGQNIRITWQFETAVLFKTLKGKDLFDTIQLQDGEMYLADVVGTVDFSVYYRPQFHPCWVLWHSGQVCATARDATDPADNLVKPQTRVAIGLGKPTNVPCDPGNNRGLDTGESFQFKFVFTGSCKFYGALFKACQSPQPQFTPATCDPICV